MAQLFDGLQITLALWQADKPVSLRTRYFEIKEATCTPLPVQKPHPPVWFGEAHPLIIEATARYAQGWNTAPRGHADVQQRVAALATACAQIGRNPAEIEKSLETQILLAPNQAALRQRLQAIIALAPGNEPFPAPLQAYLDGATDVLPAAMTDQWLIGTPDEVTMQIRSYLELGITHFLLWFMDAPLEDGLRLFAQQVAPRFRNELATPSV
jgi:alkanesulfonate monooxygenase SsuD/methylene tetrahydromethanopterin reductase-like flavin-dependent oxidoreductase (luciferase family)